MHVNDITDYLEYLSSMLAENIEMLRTANAEAIQRDLEIVQ